MPGEYQQGAGVRRKMQRMMMLEKQINTGGQERGKRKQRKEVMEG